MFKKALVAIAIAATAVFNTSLAQEIPAEVPKCWPSNFDGAGTKMITGENNVGQWIFWYCPIEEGKWKDQGVVGYPVLSLVTHPDQTIVFKNVTQLLEEYWKANVVVPNFTNAPQDFIDLHAHVRNLVFLNTPPNRVVVLPPPPVPVPVWVVAASTTGTRALYLISYGTLKLSTGTVAAGTKCDCSTNKLVVYSSTYCSPEQLAPKVALCKLQ